MALSIRTISSFTRWNDRARSNLRALGDMASDLCQPVVVNKVGQDLLDFVASEPQSGMRRITVIPGSRTDGYATWAQFRAKDDEWTICLHDDDGWKGTLPSLEFLRVAGGDLCLLPQMYPDVDPDTPPGVPVSDAAMDTRGCAGVADRLLSFSRDPQATMFGFTSSRAWNTWASFVASRNQHLPHFDWQLNHANVFSGDIVTYADFAYFRDNSNWGSRTSIAASLERTYLDLGLPSSWAQLDGILNRINSVCLLAHVHYLSPSEIAQLATLLTRAPFTKGKAERVTRLVPRPLRHYVERLVPVPGRLSQDQFPHTLLVMRDLADNPKVASMKRLLIPALRKDDPRLDSLGILEEMNSDLGRVLDIIAGSHE